MATWFLAFVLVSGAGGSLAGSQMMSAAEIAANRTPPGTSTLTATVEKRVLRAEVITRGTLARASEYPLVAWPPTDPAVGPVVTTMPLDVGAVLHEGKLAAEVGGRPVVALEGTLPAFRDLRLGDRGVDVDQLRAVLARHKLLADGTAGPFDANVVAAVKALYAKLGYLPAAGGKEANEALLRARTQKQAAETALREMTAGRQEVSRADRLAAEAAVAAAEHALAVADAQSAAAVAASVRGHASALRDLDTARAALAAARERLRQAEEDGRHPDTGLPATPTELAQLRQAVLDATRLVQSTEDTVMQRAADMEIAARQRAGQLDAARAEVERCRLLLADLGVLPPPTAAELDAARLALAAAESALADAERAASPYLPRSEVVYVPTLPRTVTKTLLRRGDNLDGPLAQVSGNDLRLDATLPSSSVGSVHIGDTAIVDDVGTSVQFDAKLVEVAASPIRDGADAGRYAVRLVPVKAPPERAVGQSLRIRLPVESTSGEALVVPATALRTAVDGSVFVERYARDGTDRVPVQVLLTASGLAAISPVAGAPLAPGDKVVVGAGAG